MYLGRGQGEAVSESPDPRGMNGANRNVLGGQGLCSNQPRAPRLPSLVSVAPVPSTPPHRLHGLLP